MQQLENPSRIKTGLIAGIAAVLTLFAMSLNIGGIDSITSIIRDLSGLFLLSAMLAFGFGLFLCHRHLKWSAFAGISIGLLCGWLIVIFVTAKI